MEHYGEFIEVEKEWVENCFSNEFIETVKKTEIHGNGAVTVPNHVEFRIQNSPIKRIRYIKPHEKVVVDIDKYRKERHYRKRMKEKKKMEKIMQSKKDGIKNLRPRQNKKVMKLIESSDESEEEEDLPTKTVVIEEAWKAKLSNHKEVHVTEEELRTNFGDTYVDMVKTMKQTYVDIPVGDYKKSTLHLYPSLRLSTAPIIQYTQSEGMDLCVSKSLASVLHSIGLIKEAKEVDQYAEHFQIGGKAETLKLVHNRAMRCLPKWLQPTKITRHNFDWKVDMNKSVIMVGVLISSDGNCSHAITLHDRFIYDANERVAIPLSQEGLDYCTSDGERRSKFLHFLRGYKYQYRGDENLLHERMTAKHHTIHEEDNIQ